MITPEEISLRIPEEFRKIFITKFKKKFKDGKKVRVYADGCFDMFHYGHARLFQQIKSINPNIELIVGVCSDADIISHKTESVMDEKERVESVKHCKWVDEVYFPAPWSPTLKLLDELKIDFIAHDAIPYTVLGDEDCYLPMKQEGKFLATLRTEGISTSELLTKILKNRDNFFQKCLQKGITRKEINLSYPEYAFYQAKGVYKNLKHLCLKDDENEKK